MLDGEIQTLVAERAFGFIKPVDGGADVFFHHSIVDAPFATLAKGQRVEYELDSRSEKPRARCVRTGEAPANNRSSRPVVRPSTNARPRDARPPTGREVFEYGFVTKLYRKTFRGFISSVKHGPEYVFAAASVTGENRFSRLAIGDYVQFLVGDPDPADPKQPVAKAVRVVQREPEIPSEKQLTRHPKARKKKPTWRT